MGIYIIINLTDKKGRPIGLHVYESHSLKVTI